jgi:hypothetical protein
MIIGEAAGVASFFIYTIEKAILIAGLKPVINMFYWYPQPDGWGLITRT